MEVRTCPPFDIKLLAILNYSVINYMAKHCRVCARSCEDEAFQCPACRSSEFEGQPSAIESYKNELKRQAYERSLQELEIMADELNSPRFRRAQPLFFIGISLATIGFVLNNAISSIFMIAGGAAISYSALIARESYIISMMIRKIPSLKKKLAKFSGNVN